LFRVLGKRGRRKEPAVKQTGKKKKILEKNNWGWFSGKARGLDLKTVDSVLYW